MTTEPSVIEAPKVEPKEPTFYDKFKTEFAKIEPPKEETPPVEPEVKVEPEAKVEPEVKKEEAPPVQKPSSPLDALLGKEKPEEKAPAVQDDLLTHLSGVKTPTQENWEQARAGIRTRDNRLKELDAEIATLKAAPKVDTNELEALKTEKAKLEERIAKQETNLKAINAEYSEDFQSLLRERDNKLHKIETRAKSCSVDPEMLLAALALPDGKYKTQQVKEALVEVDSDDKARIHTLIESLEETTEKIDDFRKDLPAKFEELQTKRELQKLDESEKNLKVLTIEFGKIVDNMPKDVVTLREVPEDVPNAAEWNKEIRDSKETAFSTIKAINPNVAALGQTTVLTVKGARYDTLEKRFLKLHSDYSEAMVRLKEFDGAGPDFKGGSKPKVEAELKPADKYRKALAGLQGAED